MAETQTAYHPSCKVPVRSPGADSGFERCGVLACYLIVWNDRDEAANECREHARIKAAKYEPLVTIVKVCGCPEHARA